MLPLLVSALSAPALAAEPGGTLGLRAGVGDHYERLELAWGSAPLWSYDFGSSRLDLTGELGVAYWRAHDSRDPRSVWQLNAIPFLRWTVGDLFYLEAGVGPTVFSRSRFAGKNLSTAFQFGDHIGAGFYLTPSSKIGVRLSHFSNADIKMPNPGLNVVQVLYDYRF